MKARRSPKRPKRRKAMDEKRSLVRRLDTAGWGLFFIWVGVAALADLGWGVGLMGVGLIILGTAAAGEYLAGGAR
jgi:hypothetical protein